METYYQNETLIVSFEDTKVHCAWCNKSITIPISMKAMGKRWSAYPIFCPCGVAGQWSEAYIYNGELKVRKVVN